MEDRNKLCGDGNVSCHYQFNFSRFPKILSHFGLLAKMCDMEWMKLITKSALVAGVMTMLVTSCAAQDTGSNHFRPHFSGQTPGEAQAILRMFKGPVTAVNPKAKTLTIKSAGEDHSFKVTSKTKFKDEDKPAAFKDVGVGKTVEVVVNMRARPDEAITVNIKGK